MFKLIASTPFKRNFKKLEVVAQKECESALQYLKDDPYNIKREANIKKLEGKLSGHYRIRIGSYRIVYSIIKNEQAVLLQTIKHRREIYR